MYHHIRGELSQLTPALAVVESGGVGFELRIPLSTFERLKGKKEILLFTHLHVREDDLRLYGFATSGERELFRLLLSVAGVGPSIALQSLSALSPEEVVRAIGAGDLKTIQRIKGVGKKLAERLVLELRDRVGVFGGGSGGGHSGTRGGAGAPHSAHRLFGNQDAADAVEALVMSLGFERRNAEEKVIEACERLQAGGRRADAEALIKECLRHG